MLSMAKIGALRAGVLLQGCDARCALQLVGEMDVDHVARLDERIAKALAGPGPVFGQAGQHLSGADTRVNLERQHPGNDGVHVVSGVSGHRPVRVFVVLDRGASLQDVVELALPSVAPLVGGKPVANGLVRGLLQIEIERGVDAEAGLMHLLGAEALFKLAAHLFLKPGRD